MEKIGRKFNYRSFFSVGMLLSGLSLPFSGFINHEFQLEELTNMREFWMSVHNSAGVLFVVLAFFHVFFNKKVLISHFKKAKGLMISKEALLAIILITLSVIMFSLHTFLLPCMF